LLKATNLVTGNRGTERFGKEIEKHVATARIVGREAKGRNRRGHTVPDSKEMEADFRAEIEEFRKSNDWDKGEDIQVCCSQRRDGPELAD